MREQHTSQFEVGQPADVNIAQAINAVGSQSIEPATTDPLNKEYLAALAFMEEPIEIVVSESTEPNAENPIQVGVNGVFVLLYRGQPTIVKRKYVDALIVKGGRVWTEEYMNPANERAVRIRQSNALKYPFSVIRDPSPKGPEWLRRRMSDLV